MSSATKPAAAVTSAALADALTARYTPDQWHVEREVTLDGRRLDLVAFNLWPSRGYTVRGFELKVSRGDWLRELADFQKSEHWLEVVDAFYLVTPPGIVEPGELPAGWGHLEWRGAKMLTRAHAAQRPLRQTLPREIVARFLGRMATRISNEERTAQYRASEVLRREITAHVEQQYAISREHERAELATLRDERNALATAAGIDPSLWLLHEKLLRVAGEFAKLRAPSSPMIRRQLETAVEDANQRHAALCTALAALDHPEGINV